MFKVIVIGGPHAGKTCLTGRATKNILDGEYCPTFGFDCQNYTTKIEDKILKLQIWDTCGQEGYSSLIVSFYIEAALAMMVYAINSKESLNHINHCLKEVKINSHPNVKIILIGNK